MKKRLLIVAGCMNTGGLEKQLLNLAKNLNPQKYIIDFTSDQRESFYKSEITENGWGYIYLPSTRDVGFLKYCICLYRLLKNQKYDIVHSHELFHSGLVMLVAKIAGVKKRIAHSHSSQDNSSRHYSFVKGIYHCLMRALINVCSTDEIGCSTEAANFLFGKSLRNAHKIHVIWNSVDVDKFLPSDRPQEREKGLRQKVVHVGRFTPLKNQSMIVEMAREAKNRNDNFQFILVGDGLTFEKEIMHAQSLDVNDYISFYGNRTDVNEILQSCDVFLLPSLFEGMPLSLIEAQAAGLPCVVSDTITNEVDFGIGLIERVRIEDPIGKWVDRIEDAMRHRKATRGEIIEAIHKKGFDNRDFASKIDAVYSQ